MCQGCGGGRKKFRAACGNPWWCHRSELVWGWLQGVAGCVVRPCVWKWFLWEGKWIKMVNMCESELPAVFQDECRLRTNHLYPHFHLHSTNSSFSKHSSSFKRSAFFQRIHFLFTDSSHFPQDLILSTSLFSFQNSIIFFSYLPFWTTSTLSCEFYLCLLLRLFSQNGSNPQFRTSDFTILNFFNTFDSLSQSQISSRTRNCLLAFEKL